MKHREAEKWRWDFTDNEMKVHMSTHNWTNVYHFVKYTFFVLHWKQLVAICLFYVMWYQKTIYSFPSLIVLRDMPTGILLLLMCAVLTTNINTYYWCYSFALLLCFVVRCDIVSVRHTFRLLSNLHTRIR